MTSMTPSDAYATDDDFYDDEEYYEAENSHADEDVEYEEVTTEYPKVPRKIAFPLAVLSVGGILLSNKQIGSLELDFLMIVAMLSATVLLLFLAMNKTSYPEAPHNQGKSRQRKFDELKETGEIDEDEVLTLNGKWILWAWALVAGGAVATCYFASQLLG